MNDMMSQFQVLTDREVHECLRRALEKMDDKDIAALMNVLELVKSKLVNVGETSAVELVGRVGLFLALNPKAAALTKPVVNTPVESKAKGRFYGYRGSRR